MVTITKKNKNADPLDDLRATDEQAKLDVSREYESVHLPALSRRSNVDRDRVREVQKELGLSIDDIAKDVTRFRANESDIAALAGIAEVAAERDDIEEQLASARDEREKLVGPLDEKIASLQVKARRLVDDETKRRGARKRLLDRAPQFCRDQLDSLQREIRRAERKLTLVSQPERHEAAWRSNSWQPLSDAPESRRAFEAWQAREREQLAQRAAERVLIARLKERRARIEEIVLSNPWPTIEDLNRVEAEFDAEEQQLADAERAAAEQAEAQAIAEV